MTKIELLPRHSTRDIKEKEKTLIQIKLSYPLITGGPESSTKQINNCLAQGAENMVESVRLHMMEEARAALARMPEMLPYKIDLGFTATCNEKGVLSFFSDLFCYAGGLQGITYRYGTSLRLGDDSPLFVTAFFPAGTDIRKVITTFVTKAQTKAQSLDERQSMQIQSAAETFYSPENVYLSERGLVVFYQPHTLGPGAAGIPIFTIPYSENGPFPPQQLALPERP